MADTITRLPRNHNKHYIQAAIDTNPEIASMLTQRTSLNLTPEVIAESWQYLGLAISNWIPLQNAFIPHALNTLGLEIVIMNQWENKFKIFKSDLPVGDTVTTKDTQLLEVEDYDIAEGQRDVFKIRAPKVQQHYHIVNSKKKIVVTVSPSEFQLAVTAPYGIQALLNNILSKINLTAEVLDYNYFLALFLKGYQSGWGYSVAVPTITDDITGKNVLQLIKTYAAYLTYPTNRYNPSGMDTVTPLESQVIIMDEATYAGITTQVYSSVFNDRWAILANRIFTVDHFPEQMGNVTALLVDERIFQVYNSLTLMRDIDNPSNLTRNVFLHLWNMYSLDPKLNFIIFKDTGTTVTALTIEDPTYPTIEKGHSYKLNAIATGTNAVVTASWTVTGNTSNLTYMIDDGVLVIGTDETATSLVVTATSNVNKSVSASKTITLGEQTIPEVAPVVGSYEEDTSAIKSSIDGVDIDAPTEEDLKDIEKG